MSQGAMQIKAKFGIQHISILLTEYCQKEINLLLYKCLLRYVFTKIYQNHNFFANNSFQTILNFENCKIIISDKVSNLETYMYYWLFIATVVNGV